MREVLLVVLVLLFSFLLPNAFSFTGTANDYYIQGTIAKGSYHKQQGEYELRFFVTDQPCVKESSAGYELFLCYYFSGIAIPPGGEPKAVCGVTPLTGTPNQTVFQYNAGASINAAEYAWDWENNGTIDVSWNTSAIEPKVWSTEGTFSDVNLMVKNVAGKIDSMLCPAVKTEYLPPVLDLPPEVSYNEGSHRDLNLMEFVSDPDSSIWDLSWAYNFSVKTFGLGDNTIIVSFLAGGIARISGGSKGGKYKLTFTATDSTGKSGSDEMIVKVLEAGKENEPPEAECEVKEKKHGENKVGDKWVLNPEKSKDEEDEKKKLIVRWDTESNGSWDYVYFNAGEKRTHMFSTPGVKTVKLQIEDTGGKKNEALCNITVLPVTPGSLVDVLNIKKLTVSPKVASSGNTTTVTAAIENVTGSEVSAEVYFWATTTLDSPIAWDITTSLTVPANGEIDAVATILNYPEDGFEEGKNYWIYAEVSEDEEGIDETDLRENKKRELFTLLGEIPPLMVPETDYLVAVVLAALIGLILMKK